MDPRDQFKARFQAYQDNLHKQKTIALTQNKSNPFNKIKVTAVAVILLAIGLPTTLALVSQPQDTRQRASAPVSQKAYVKKVGDEFITEADIDRKIESLFKKDAASLKTNATVRETALNSLIREKIITQEAEARKITVELPEIDQKIESLKLNPDTADRNEVFLLILEEKVKNAVVASNTIDLAQVNTNTISSIDAEKARITLEALGRELTLGRTLTQADQNIKTRISGYYDKLELKPNTAIYQDSDINEEIMNAVKNAKKGDILPLTETKDGILYLAKVLEVNADGKATFSDWLSSMIKTKVE